jgi:hemerythrin-like domain-containing protein
MRTTHVLLSLIAAALAAGALAGCAAVHARGTDHEMREAAQAAGVSPPEDLMREHGVLRRILLVYEEAIRRLEAAQDVPPEALSESAGIVRRFVEDYHEKLEEDHIFPKFEQAGKLVDLVQTLRAQHKAGRALTDEVQRLSAPEALKDAENRRKLEDTLRRFIRMYRPHAAREDTVLFPAIRGVVAPEEFDRMGDMFEGKENELFGEGGFDKVVEQVAAIEKTLGIYELSSFTPQQ